MERIRAADINSADAEAEKTRGTRMNKKMNVLGVFGVAVVAALVYAPLAAASSRWSGTGGTTAPGIPPSGCYATDSEVTNYYIGSYPITVGTVTYSILDFHDTDGGVAYQFRGTNPNGTFFDGVATAIWTACDSNTTPDPDKDLPCPPDVCQQTASSNPINGGSGNKYQKE